MAKQFEKKKKEHKRSLFLYSFQKENKRSKEKKGRNEKEKKGIKRNIKERKRKSKKVGVFKGFCLDLKPTTSNFAPRHFHPILEKTQVGN